ncbi:MAG: hypothetical protein V4463_17840 [Pseudomonadota bacterium]
MKTVYLSLACASLLAIAACSSTSTKDSMSNTSSNDTMSPAAALPNASVTLIEVLPVDTSMGSSGTAGTSSGTMPAKTRVTLRMDDGSTRSIMLDATPSYKAGDRVNVTNDVVTPAR